MEFALVSARRARAAALRVEVAQGVEAIEGLDAVWDDLVLQQPCPNPTLLGGWQRQLARSDRRRPLLLRVFDGRSLVAAGMFARSRRHGLVRASWAGAAWHDFSPDALIAPGRADAAETLVELLLEYADVVKLVTVGDGVLARTVTRVARHAIVEPARGTYVVELPPPTLAKMAAAARADERRAERAGVAVRVAVHSEPDAVGAALERLFRIYRERWRDRDPRVGHFSADRATREWNRRATSSLASDGHVRIAEVFEDDRLVASNMALVAGTAAVGRTKAMRPGNGLRSPGHLSTTALVERLVEERVQLLDVGGGVLDPGGPKDRLAPTRRPFVSLTVATRPLLRTVFPVALAAQRRVTARRDV